MVLGNGTIPMLVLISKKVTYNQLSLLAILYIAAGMPLIHPAFHNHFDDHGILANQGVGQISAITHDNRLHNCPICFFLASSQLLGSGLNLIIAANELLGTISPVDQLSLVKCCIIGSEPRAPPGFSLI
jgi:hypothetical protein